MELSQYCAYWFVRHRLGVPTDNQPPADDPVDPAVDRSELAASLATAVNRAQMRTWPHVILVDPVRLGSDAAQWKTVFAVRDALLRSAYSPEGADVKVLAGFADYIVTRWIHRYVWKVEIGVRPVDKPLPNTYGGQEKRLLAEALNATVHQCGLAVSAETTLRESGSWKTVAAVRQTYVTHVKSGRE
jgi:hypothetical protein